MRTSRKSASHGSSASERAPRCRRARGASTSATAGEASQHAHEVARAPGARRRRRAAPAARSRGAHPRTELRQRHRPRWSRAVLDRPRARSRAPNVDCSRPCTLPSPMPGPSARERRAARAPASIPSPSSHTRSSTSAPEVAAEDLHAARHPAAISTPCRTAFSTSGWSDSTRHARPAAPPGRPARAPRSRSPKRACSSRRYFSTYCSSSASVTYGRWRAERVTDELRELAEQLARLLGPRVDRTRRPPSARCR